MGFFFYLCLSLLTYQGTALVPSCPFTGQYKTTVPYIWNGGFVTNGTMGQEKL